jgi:hypothetical protein
MSASDIRDVVAQQTRMSLTLMRATRFDQTPRLRRVAADATAAPFAEDIGGIGDQPEMQ